MSRSGYVELTMTANTFIGTTAGLIIVAIVCIPLIALRVRRSRSRR